MVESGTWHLIRHGQDQPFVVAGDVIVGRSKQADLRVSEGYVSRRHARLWVEGGRLMVEDLGSANGTFLNGRRIERREVLGPGDRVCFDETEFYVETVADRLSSDPNATAHRPDDDPEFQKPQRPADWDAGRTQPLTTAETALSIPDDDLDFALDAPPPAVAAPPPAVAPTLNRDAAPSASLPQARPVLDEPDFGLTDEAPLDLSLGQARLDEPEADAAPSPVSATVVMAPGEPSAPAAPPPVGATVVMSRDEAPLSAPPPSVGAGATSGLLLLSGAEEGVLYELAEGRVGIGRSHECDIRIDESSVSKRHAELMVQPGNCRIYDTSNSNGVFVNGDRVDDVALNPGDVIRLGRIELMFDDYDRLAEGGVGGDGASGMIWLVAGFGGTAAVAGAAWLIIQALG